MRTVIASLAAAMALVLAACGGTEDEGSTTTIPGNADPADAALIDDWAHTLSRGDVDGAAAFFAIPSVAQNGPTLRIDSRADAKLFNASLPCGASLEEAEVDGEYTIATFRLTERPGEGVCDAAADATARTAFRIEDGKFVEWRRVFDGGVEDRPAPQSSA
jgi:hypothetical protein